MNSSLSRKLFATAAMVCAVLLAMVNTPARQTQAAPVADHVPFQRGDVFAGVGAGKYNHYNATGVLIEVLDSKSNSRQNGGMCFDAAGNLYATNFTAETMSKFGNRGELVYDRWGGFGGNPESCVVDAAGNIYVGEAYGSRRLRKFDSTGKSLTDFRPATQRVGIDWIDLASDQCTMFYTSEGSSVKRFNVCTGTQLSDFATNLASPCFALRLRSNGEVMVACESQAYRLDSSGKTLQTYSRTNYREISRFFALNLDIDGTSFWTAGSSTGNVYKIDIESGNLLRTFDATPQGSGDVGGLAIFGELTVSQPTPTPVPPTEPPQPTPTRPTLPTSTPPTPPTPEPVGTQPPPPTETPLPPTPKPAEEGKLPIIFVHGWAGALLTTPLNKWNATPEPEKYFEEMDDALKAAHYDVYTVTLATTALYTPKIESNVKALREKILEVSKKHNNRRVILIAHSMGGLVSRAYIEGYNSDSKDKNLNGKDDADFIEDNRPVRELITFGTLHEGVLPGVMSVLLNPILNAKTQGAPAISLAAICHPFSGLKTPPGPGVCEFLQGPTLIHPNPFSQFWFNDKYKLRSDVTYRMVTGDLSFWNRSPGGLALWPLTPRSDGIVPVDSGQGKGLKGSDKVDTYVTDEAHGLGLGKFSYFSHKDDFVSPLPLLDQYMSNSKSYKGCIKPLFVPPATGNGDGDCGSGDGLQAKLLAPPEPASMGVTPFEQGQLLPGQTVTRTVSSEGGNSLFVSLWQSGTLAMTLVSPNGEQIDPTYAAANTNNVSYEVSDTGAAYYFTSTVVGNWQMVIRAVNVPTEGVPYLTYAGVQSSVMLTTSMDRVSYAIDASATIRATLTGSPTNVQARAMVLRSDGRKDTVTLSAKGGGIYEGAYTIPKASGYTEVRVTAQGTNGDGVAFERGETMVFQIQSGDFKLANSYKLSTEECFSGKGQQTTQGIYSIVSVPPYSALVATVGVRANVAGPVALAADLVDTKGNVVAHANANQDVKAGTSNMTLSFSWEEIAESRLNGPYKLTNVVLFDERGASLIAQEAENVATTTAYNFSDFMCVGMPTTGVQHEDNGVGYLLAAGLLLMAGGWILRRRSTYMQ